MFFHLLESAGYWEAIGADAVQQTGPIFYGLMVALLTPSRDY